MKIKIEKNVPIPDGAVFLGVLKQMEIGDSFKTNVQKRANMSMYSKKTGFKFCTRIITGNRKLIRVWRIK